MAELALGRQESSHARSRRSISCRSLLGGRPSLYLICSGSRRASLLPHEPRGPLISGDTSDKARGPQCIVPRWGGLANPIVRVWGPRASSCPYTRVARGRTDDMRICWLPGTVHGIVRKPSSGGVILNRREFRGRLRLDLPSNCSGIVGAGIFLSQAPSRCWSPPRPPLFSAGSSSSPGSFMSSPRSCPDLSWR